MVTGYCKIHFLRINQIRLKKFIYWVDKIKINGYIINVTKGDYIGGKIMLTSFGKFCRKLRIDNGKLLFDMAQQLGVSSAFLSKVENGKAKPPVGWENTIINSYDLSEEQVSELQSSIYEARCTDAINISDMSTSDKDMMLAFARKLDTMEPENKEKIKQLLGY